MVLLLKLKCLKQNGWRGHFLVKVRRELEIVCEEGEREGEATSYRLGATRSGGVYLLQRATSYRLGATTSSGAFILQQATG